MRPAQLATPKYTFSELHQNKKKKKKRSLNTRRTTRSAVLASNEA